MVNAVPEESGRASPKALLGGGRTTCRPTSETGDQVQPKARLLLTSWAV